MYCMSTYTVVVVHKKWISSFKDTCSVLTCHILYIEAAPGLLCKCILADQFNAGALAAGGSDDDDGLLFRENKKVFSYCPAVLLKKNVWLSWVEAWALND